MNMGKCKVLIVEDEFIMRQGIKHMINWEKEGFSIVGDSSNGKEALELIEETKPNIIISDIVMPILNGVDFSKIVHEKYPEIQIVILSSYDKFDYVKSTLLNGAVDYILKPTLTPKSLLATLKKAVNRIPGMELIQGEVEDYHGLIEKHLLGYGVSLDINKFSSIFPNSCFRLLGIDLKRLPKVGNNLAQEIMDKMDDFFEKNKDLINFKIIINDRILLYIINYKLSHNHDLVNIFEQFVDKDIFNENKVFFVITEKFDSILNLKNIYDEKFLPFLGQKFYYKNLKVLHTYNCKIEKCEKFAFDKFYNYVNSKELNRAIKMTENYIVKAISVKLDEQKLKSLVKNLIYTILVSMEEGYEDSDELRSIYFDKIEQASDESVLVEYIQNIFSDLRVIISERFSKEDNIKNILEYINNNFSSNLDLGAISKKFNFNYYYLSSYFSSHCKEGFSEYLNKIRVEKACELLRDEKCYVSEISSMVGYSDHSYFCRVFKKITGYTPSSYRRIKMLQEDKDDKE